jgi:WD40 repeat protein
MRKKRLAVLAVMLISSVAALAVTPQFWENFSQDELLKGNLKRVSLTSEGRLLFAPAYDLVYDTGQPYIFSMVRDKAGNLYVGTGDSGKVFKIDPQGKGSLYFQSKELDVFALALDSNDTLYVGTSPDGKVYKVTGPGQSTEYCNPETKYIWSMVFDNSGNLYVGTGATGTIYKVDRSGGKSVFYTCADNHVVCLTRNNDNLLAGTSPGGLVIEITPEGKGFALMDTPLEEVHSITVDRFGIIYAIASSSKGMGALAPAPKPAASGKTASASSATITVEAILSPSEKPKESKTVTVPGGEKESAGAKSAIYAFTRDGSSETVYSSNEQMIFDAVVRNDGSLLVATGPKGRLLSIDNAKQVTVVTDTAEEDVTRVLAAGDIIYAGGSNQGRLYKLQPHRADEGTFESDSLDAKTVASWGKISWHVVNPKGARIELSTRTGNTAKPDGSWSEWSAPYTAPGQQITSPRARYLQWRATFKGGSSQDTPADMLDRVQIPYLQQNLRPQVTDIDVLPFGIELQKQPSLALGTVTMITPATTSDGRSLNAPREHGRERQPIAPRQVLQPGAQSFTWKASDDNDDSLEYSLYFRGEGETEWKLLEKKLTDTFYTLNTASLPDGTYRLKVVASDAPSNPYDKFLIGELVSDPFVIANSSPQLEITSNKLNGKKVEVQFRARVNTGNIATAEFSVDGGEWLLVFPVDGIADSAQEEYRIMTPELATGEHLIGIRASDRNGNTGTSKLVVRIP